MVQVSWFHQVTAVIDIEALGGGRSMARNCSRPDPTPSGVDGFDTRPDILSPESIELMTDHQNDLAPLGWKQ